jgi:hypothetical protein
VIAEAMARAQDTSSPQPKRPGSVGTDLGPRQLRERLPESRYPRAALDGSRDAAHLRFSFSAHMRLESGG